MLILMLLSHERINGGQCQSNAKSELALCPTSSLISLSLHVLSLRTRTIQEHLEELKTCVI